MNDNYKKKILIVTDYYYPHISGIVTYIDQMINSFKNENYLITILTTQHDKNLDLIEKYRKIEIIRCKPTINISRGSYSLQLVYKFFKIYKKYDYINIHFPLTEIFPIFLFLSKNTILNYHCLPDFNFYQKIFSFYFYFFGLISIFISKKNVVLSKDYFENIFFHKFFLKNVVEIPPYVKDQNNKKLNPIKKNNSDVLKIGYLGRICEEKGLENLILASELLEKRKIKHKMIIAGDLEDMRFEKYIKKVLLRSKENSNIRFVGKIEEKNKSEFYQFLNVFALPSVNSFEAFGIVQLEAMSYGVPVVASNIKGVRSVIKKTNNGLLFQKNNVKDLVEKLLFIRNNNNLNSDKIIEKVNLNFSKECFDKKILKLF